MNSTPSSRHPVAELPGDRLELLGLSKQELRTKLDVLVDRPFRADQIYHAIYRRGIVDFALMTDLGLEMRSRLARSCRIGVPAESTCHVSRDGTRKLLLELADGATIEAVDIPDGQRRTLCLSSQAGCALGCTFCVTGYWGAGRNLTAGEIVGQVLAIRRGEPREPTGLNLVFMGMGEPLHNLENLQVALEILTETISWRRITVSTVGVVPGIEEIGRWPRRPNLAVSLHAPDDERRGRIMPINASYPLAVLMAALRDYPLERGRRITFEYLLLRDFNDAVEDADAVARLLRGVPAKVNLIPVNPDPVLEPRIRPPEAARVEAFRARLEAHHYVATVRRRRGDDVSAACGQLRAPDRAPRGFRRSNVSL